MPDQSTADAVAPWIQAGGIVAFASAVWLELRALRPTLVALHAVTQILLERERMRSGPFRKATQSESES